MIAQIKNLFFGFFIAVMAFAAFASFNTSLPVSTQGLVPDVCPEGGCPVTGNRDLRGANSQTVVDILIGAAQFLTYIGVGLSVLFMVWGGIRYITAGSSDGAENAKKILINATIGLVVSIVAFTVVNILAQLLQSNIGEQILDN